MKEEILNRSALEKYVSLKKYKVLTNNSLLSHEIRDSYENTLSDVIDRVNNGHYHPHRPLGVYSIPKHNYVPRLIPVLQPSDNILYHYLIKRMEAKLLAHKPEDVKSFGAYRVLSLAKKSEDQQREYDFIDIDELSIGKYTVSYQWYPGYGDFAETVKNYFDKDPKKVVFVKTDIANFYDNIDLRLLENKVRSVLDKKNLSDVNVLFRLLQGVNSYAYKYNYQGKGLPQDETSDCSRLLSNFFLYDFDDEFDRLCKKMDCLYVRFCDDMIIMCNSKLDAQKLVHAAAEILNKSSLSLNSSKTKIFNSRSSFEEYWLYDEHLEITNNIPNLSDQKVYDFIQDLVLRSCAKERGYQLIKRWAKLQNPKMVDNPKLIKKLEQSLDLLDANSAARYIKKQIIPTTKDRILKRLYSNARKSNYSGDLLWFRKVCEILNDARLIANIDRYAERKSS